MVVGVRLLQQNSCCCGTHQQDALLDIQLEEDKTCTAAPCTAAPCKNWTLWLFCWHWHQKNAETCSHPGTWDMAAKKLRNCPCQMALLSACTESWSQRTWDHLTAVCVFGFTKSEQNCCSMSLVSWHSVPIGFTQVVIPTELFTRTGAVGTQKVRERVLDKCS